VRDVKEIESYLFRMAESGLASDVECNVELQVLEAGSWIIKFRSDGIIVNNIELVMKECIQIDAEIKFFSLGNFWATKNGSMQLEDGSMNITGTEEAINVFRVKILNTTTTTTSSSSATTTASEGADGAGGFATSSSAASGGGGDSSGLSAAQIFASAAAAEKHAHRAHASTTTTSHAAFVVDEEDRHQRPLRAGWLLKKRDILTGWQSRYFKVYVGRMEYFLEEKDTSPRAVIALLGAKVTQTQEIRIHGALGHYQISVEPNFGEKRFTLASESSGDNGKQDAESWFMTFDLASKPAAQAYALLNGGRTPFGAGIEQHRVSTPAGSSQKSGGGGGAGASGGAAGSSSSSKSGASGKHSKSSSDNLFRSSSKDALDDEGMDAKWWFVILFFIASIFTAQYIYYNLAWFTSSSGSETITSAEL